jgi:heat shock protein HslJ
MRIRYAIACLALVVVSPVASQSPPDRLEGPSWRLMSISMLDAATLDQSPRAIARFTEGRLSGFSGCNRFKGSYTISGDRVNVGRQTHTVNKCADPAVEVENALKVAFAEPVRYQVADGRMTATTQTGATMVFEAEPAHALEGVEWEVTEFDNGKGVLVRPAKGTTVSLSFRGDGALIGNAGCNLFKAPYQRDGERLTIEPAVATHRKCTGLTVMDQERIFLATLLAAKTWTLRGELLDLSLGNGRRALTAERPAN